MYQWFRVFNKTEFLALGLVSRNYILTLEGIGQKEILVTKGSEVGITYNGVFLLLGLNENNPFEFDGHAIYIDANDDVYLGIEIES